MFFWSLLVVLVAIVCGIFGLQTADGIGSIVPASGVNVSAFTRLRNNYVAIYSLMMAGDWLQGPYVYALYQYYGYQVKDIGRLFIGGFGSSMIFGTIVGALADKYGRKRAALLYVITYTLSCATKHSADYWVLMLGRLLGGIATSLLFSAFESWIVAEHFARNFDEKWLGDTFSKAVFMGNGLCAILAGLLANYLVVDLQLGPVAPFDASAVVLLVGGAIVAATWAENYGGDGQAQHSLRKQLQLAVAAIMGDERVALLGAMQSMFEGAMYSFIFLWTPALSPRDEDIPHGMIFACFMAASMVGSALSGLLLKRWRPESFMKYVFLASAVVLLVPFLFHLRVTRYTRGSGAAAAAAAEGQQRGITLEGQVQLVAFCLFEVMIGMFWPSMMTMRAHHVPEQLRSTIINVFRIPLNLFVCLILYNVHLLPLSAMFGVCSMLLFITACCQARLERLSCNNSLESPAGADAAPAAAAAAAAAATLLYGEQQHNGPRRPRRSIP